MFVSNIDNLGANVDLSILVSLQNINYWGGEGFILDFTIILSFNTDMSHKISFSTDMSHTVS